MVGFVLVGISDHQALEEIMVMLPEIPDVMQGEFESAGRGSAAQLVFAIPIGDGHYAGQQ